MVTKKPRKVKNSPATLWELFLHQLEAAKGYKRPRSKEEKMRDEIFQAILGGCRTVKSLVAKTGYSSSAVSKYMQLLDQQGSIRIIRSVRNGPCRIEVLRSY